MSTLQPIANPFALLLDPEQVLASIEHSDRLERLQRRICRPLDKPMIPAAKPVRGRELADFDDAIDADIDEPDVGDGLN
ncbi:hypothetical protein [Aquabacterium humicola]|uniref:hypothetical protein n=1 Tax=Aquabacterium humicola TaxID=3237377 RepID=UPI002542B211|nr:hypothetical protein [Rubrivivax pictus]